MVRRYKKQYDEENSLDNIVPVIGVFYTLYLILEYFTNRANFWRWLIYGFVFIILLIAIFYIWNRAKEKVRQSKKDHILSSINQAGLEDYIKNFISRFGLGQEKSKNIWNHRNYNIDWSRINDLRDFLASKNIVFSPSDISVLLSYYIDEREYRVTSNSISAGTHNFSKLNGSDFEKLLYRLYEAMGYTVLLSGKVGDQGGDLVATKGQDRILIQAKCYLNSTIGNSAVQEAAAARSHYDCNTAIVIATNSFTKEATELAKTNMVELIPKELLQKMLLDYLKESWN